MVYSLRDINWVIAGSVRDKLWTCGGICKKSKVVKLFLLLFFGWCEKRETIERSMCVLGI